MNYIMSSSDFQIPTQCAVSVITANGTRSEHVMLCTAFGSSEITTSRSKCIVPSAEIYMLYKEIIFQTVEKLQGMSVSV